MEQEQREEEEREYQERLRKLEEQERKQRARQQEVEERERRREEERRGPTEDKTKVQMTNFFELVRVVTGSHLVLKFHADIHEWVSKVIHAGFYNGNCIHNKCDILDTTIGKQSK